MATTYFRNYSARKHAQRVRAGEIDDIGRQKREAEKEHAKKVAMDTSKSAYNFYMKQAEKASERKLSRTQDGMNLYQETPMPDEIGKGKLISNYLPTETEMNPDTAGQLIGGEDMTSFNKDAYSIYEEKDWKGLYKDVYKEQSLDFDPLVPGKGDHKNLHQAFKSGDKDVLNIVQHDLQVGVADKLNLQGTARDQFLKNQEFSKLGAEVGAKASKNIGLKVGEKLGKTVDAVKASKAGQTISNIGKTAGKVGKTVGKYAGYAGGIYQAGTGAKDMIDEGEVTEEGAYEVISGGAKVAGTYLMSVPEPTGITKLLGGTLLVGSTALDFAKDEIFDF